MKKVTKTLIFTFFLMILNINVNAIEIQGQENLYNVALGKNVVEGFNDGRVSKAPEVITDGSAETGFWRATASSEKGAAYIIIDLDNLYYCDSVKLVTQGIGSNLKVELEYSVDGEDWKTYGSIEGNFTISEKGFFDFDMPMLSPARYIKLTSSEYRKVFAVYEVSVYGILKDSVNISGDLTNIALGKEPTASSTMNNDNNVAPTRVTDGSKSPVGWSWMSEGSDPLKYIEIDLGTWVNVKKIALGVMTGNLNNDGDNVRRLINVYGSATGQFENDKIKLADIGMEPVNLGETVELEVPVKNMVRYVRVMPKVKTQFGSEFEISRFGLGEVEIWADASDTYNMTLEGESILNDRKYDNVATNDDVLFTGIVCKPTGIMVITKQNAENTIGNRDFRIFGSFNKFGESEFLIEDKYSSGAVSYFGVEPEEALKYIKCENTADSISEILVFYKEAIRGKYYNISDIELYYGENVAEGLNCENWTVKATILNEDVKLLNGKMILAIYKDKKIKKIVPIDFSAPIDEETDVLITEANPFFGEDMSGCRLKVFFIEDITAINPYCSSKTFR